jgi:hypothetical protein
MAIELNGGGAGIAAAAQAAAKSAATKTTGKTTTTKAAPKATVKAATPYSTALGQAQSQAATEVAGQVAPLQGQVTQLTKQGGQEQSALGSEFNQLLPYAQQAAAYTGQFNQMASSDANAIFQQAGSQMNTMQQNAAAQAQRLAQQTGGPVSTGTFTAGLDPFTTATAESGAVGRLTGLELGTLGTDQATQFSGQVLPAMEMEQRRTAAADITNKIDAIKTQISTIEGTKSKLVNAKLPALLAAQQNFQLNKEKMALDKSNAEHNWQNTKRALDQSGAKLALASRVETFNEGVDTAKLGQEGVKLKITAAQVDNEATHMSNEDANAAAKLGLSKEEYILKEHQYAVSDSIAQQRADNQSQSNLVHFIDGFVGGTSSNKPVSVTQKHILNPNDPLVQAAMHYSGLAAATGKKPPANVFYDPKTKQWYTYTKTTMTPSQFATQHGGHGSPMSDPNALYRVMRQALPNSDPKMLQNLIRVKLGIPSWKPGQSAAAPATQDLAKLTLPKLTDVAVQHGFKPSPVAATRQQLIDYIHAHHEVRSAAAA